MFYKIFSDLNKSEDYQVSLSKDSPTPTGKILINLVIQLIVILNNYNINKNTIT